MEFFRITRDIPFMRHALVFNVISLVTFVAAVVFLAIYGLNLGVDFRGGTVIEVNYGHPVDFARVRTALDKLGLGEFSAHRVAPVRGQRARITAIMTYDEQPDRESTDEANALVYGARAAKIIAERRLRQPVAG